MSSDVDATPRNAQTELRARFTTTDAGDVELTLSPSVPSTAEETTAWISAREGSFIDLHEVR